MSYYFEFICFFFFLRINLKFVQIYCSVKFHPRKIVNFIQKNLYKTPEAFIRLSHSMKFY